GPGSVAAAGARAAARATACGRCTLGVSRREEREAPVHPFAAARRTSHGRVDRRRHGALLLEEVLAAHAHVLVGRHRAQGTTRRRRLATISERADLRAVLVVVLGGLPGEEPRGLLAHARECAPDRAGAGSRLLGAAEDVL